MMRNEGDLISLDTVWEQREKG